MKFESEKKISDESRFCQMNDNSWRWMKRGDISDDIFFYKTKYPQNLMISGAIGIGYKSKLIFVDQSVDEIEYRRVFEESEICKLDEKLGESGRFYFMQDGAPAHNCKTTRLFLKKRCSFIKRLPPNSPDLNPIENLWGQSSVFYKKKQ